ncbi:hypothetical protein ACOME3_003857 [Neoechinorhynchus agilis]
MLANAFHPFRITFLLDTRRESYGKDELTVDSLIKGSHIEWPRMDFKEYETRYICRHIAFFGECMSKTRCRNLVPMLGKCELVDIWPKEGTREMKIKVKSVISPNLVYGFPVDGFEPVEAPSMDVDLQLAMTNPQVARITQANTCLYAYRDNVRAWKRVNLLSEDGLLVLLIDSGLCRILKSTSELYELPEKFQQIPPCVIECVVCGLRPVDQGQSDWPPTTSLNIHKHFFKKTVMVNVISAVRNSYNALTVFASTFCEVPSVTLGPSRQTISLHGKSMRQFLLENRLGIDNREPHISVIEQLFGIRREYDRAIDFNDTTSGQHDQIVRIINLSEKSLHVIDQTRYGQFEELNREIQLSAPITISLLDVHIGQLCLVQRGDKQWLRCRLVRDRCVEKGVRILRFASIDLGDEFEIEKRSHQSLKDDVKLLTPRFSNIPPFHILVPIPIPIAITSIFKEPNMVMQRHQFRIEHSTCVMRLMDIGLNGVAVVPSDLFLTCIAFHNSNRVRDYLERVQKVDDDLEQFMSRVANEAECLLSPVFLSRWKIPVGDQRDYDELDSLSLQTLCLMCECRCFNEHFIKHVYDSTMFHYVSDNAEDSRLILEVSLRLISLIFSYGCEQSTGHYIIDFLIDNNSCFIPLLTENPNYFSALWKSAIDFDRCDIVGIIPEVINGHYARCVLEHMKTICLTANTSESLTEAYQKQTSILQSIATEDENDSSIDDKKVDSVERMDTISSDLSDDSSTRSKFSCSSEEDRYMANKFARSYIKVLRKATKNQVESKMDFNQPAAKAHLEDDARIYNEKGKEPLPYPNIYWSQKGFGLRLRLQINLTEEPQIE